MTTTKTTPRPTGPARPPSRRSDALDHRRMVIWLWVLAAIAVIATAVAVAYATGLVGDEPAADVPSGDVPADEVPADEVPADDEPADEVPADEPADQVPADDPADEPAAEVRYDEEPRANWDVVGVAADDVLNVRDAPGVDGAIIETLAHDAAEFESTGRIAWVGEQLWREVIVPGDGVGWVNAAFLTETAPPAEVRYDEEPRANWDVVGVAADDVLNVRDAPGVDGAIIETLAHDAAELESTGRIAQVGDQLWREIVVPGDGVGWVSAAYLTETT